MPNYKPYLTDDGSIGLFSGDFNDIFHSRYGALTEAYEKFIYPSDIDYYLENKNRLNVLDICYGIGYNTKALLNFIIEKYCLKNIRNKVQEKVAYNVSRYTDKIKDDVNTNYNETIYTDNKKENSSFMNNNKIKNNIFYNTFLPSKFKSIFKFAIDDTLKFSNMQNECFFQFSEINIDTIEYEKEFVFLSPFIKNYSYNINYSLSPFVNTLILSALIYQFKEDLPYSIKNYKIIKEENKFFDIMSLKIAKKITKKGYNYTPREFLSPFLHNIYYQNLSKRQIEKPGIQSFKNYQHVSKRDLCNFYSFLGNKIKLNFFIDDARVVLQNIDKTKKYDVIFLDAFTPSKLPTLWTIEFFKKIVDVLDNDGVLVTYSSSARVRSAMIGSGLFIGNIRSPEGYDFGTIASKSILKIKNPLDDIEKGLLNTKAGIPYRDFSLKSTSNEIFKNLENEINTSTKISSSKYMKGHHYEI